MKIEFNWYPLQIVKNLTYGVVFLAIINLVIQFAKYQFNYRQEWMVIFNMDREMNFPTLYTVILLAICAFLLRLITREKKYSQSSFYKYWRNLSWIFCFLVFDEALQVHEVLIFPPLKPYLPPLFHFIWVIPYGIAVVFFLYYYTKFTFRLPREITLFFIVAGGLYIGGALGMEMLQGVWVRAVGGMQNLGYALLASLEEVMEMMGLIVFIYALMTYITKYMEQLINVQIKILNNQNKY
jgi:hypothetical protein